MLGLGVISKTENNGGGSNSLKTAAALTQFRPEGNVGYALANGLWGTVGGHASVISGDMTDAVAPLGLGLQASVGYVPVRTLGFDLGYYLSVHSLSNKAINNIEANGSSVEKTESWMLLKQLRARATYYF